MLLLTSLLLICRKLLVGGLKDHSENISHGLIRFLLWIIKVIMGIIGYLPSFPWFLNLI